MRLTIRNIVIPGLKVAINGAAEGLRVAESLETKTCHKLHYIAARRHLCFIKRRNLVTLIVLTVTHTGRMQGARATGHSVNSRLLTGLCIWILRDAPLTSTSRYRNQCLWSSPWRLDGRPTMVRTAPFPRYPIPVRLIPPRLSHSGLRGDATPTVARRCRTLQDRRGIKPGFRSDMSEICSDRDNACNIR